MHRRRLTVAIDSLEPRTLFAAPTILSETFRADGAPAIVVQFSTDVSASIDASTLILQDVNNLTTFQVTTSSTTNQISFAWDAATNTATWTFPKYTKALPDSNYRAILYGERVTDSTGTPMASDSTFNFCVYNGDTNGDGKVNAIDFNALAANYGKSARVYSQGDLDLNGAVNSADFTKLAQRFNTVSPAVPPTPRRWDVVTFNNNGGSDRYTQAMFNVHNTPEPGGMMFFMGGDSHRSEILAQGNRLAIYYNNFNADQQIADPNIMINRIQTDWSVKLFTTTGIQPTWVALNEISPSLWPSSQQYRDWVKTVVHTLHVKYGHEVMVFSPFANPSDNSADWKALTKDAYIGVENYLSGVDMKNHDFSVDWAKAQYAWSITAFGNVGVPASRLIETEEYAMTDSTTTGWGRGGVTDAEWDLTIINRSTAIHQTNYFASCGYAWGKNAMLEPETDQIHFIQTYRAQALP